MFANTQMAGVDLGVPDVCMTPVPPAGTPVPMAYPDTGLGPMASGSVGKVLFSSAPAHNLGTTVKQTNGDNPGVGTGVASGTVMGPSRHVTGAFTVLLAGLPASRLTSTSLQNSTNVPGCRIAPSQVKVVLLAP